MSFTIVRAAEISLREQAAVANRAFAGYVGGWADLDASGLARFLCLQGAALFHSRFIRVDDELAGFGYINRTGAIPRLAGMALSPEARGTGAAAHLLDHLLGEARARGDRAMVLEVIEQNPRAHAFYRRQGFRDIAHLDGWRLAAATARASLPGSGSAPREISILEAIAQPTDPEYPAIPWQISRHAAAKTELTRAYQAGPARIVLSDPATAPIRLHALLTGRNDWAALRVLLADLLQRFPDREFFSPPLWPEEYGREIFAPLGFAREPLAQFLMRCEL